MPRTIDEAWVEAIVALHPLRAASFGPSAFDESLKTLVQREQARRGQADPLTGAFDVLALTQGALLKHEYDLSTHGHLPAWEVGAVVADVKGLIHVNMRYGFPVGDRVLQALAEVLRAYHPRGPLVRLHPDALAALLPPSAEQAPDPAQAQALRSAFSERAGAALPEDGEPPLQLGLTLAYLRLQIVRPAHWQVLGPLVWTELERALTLARRGEAGLVLRHLVLDGAV